VPSKPTATPRRRRLAPWILAGAAVLVVLGVAGPFVFIHFIEGPAPAKLSLPPASRRTTANAGSPSSTTGAGAASSSKAKLTGALALPGKWNVGTGSVVGYRVQEVLVGQQSTAVGRTSKVWGALTISGASVTKASFTADMASVVSDQPQRNAQFDGRIMDVATYPTASFALAQPVLLGAIPAGGQTKSYQATGDLTMHGVTKPVTFTLSAERLGSSIYVLADINIVFENWDIANPSFTGFVTTQDHGILEVLLHLTKAAGNAAVKTTSVSSSGPFPGGGHHAFPGGEHGKSPGGAHHAFPGGAPGEGPGGPITVPSTTVPPLSVPKADPATP